MTLTKNEPHVAILDLLQFTPTGCSYPCMQNTTVVQQEHNKGIHQCMMGLHRKPESSTPIKLIQERKRLSAYLVDSLITHQSLIH